MRISIDRVSTTPYRQVFGFALLTVIFLVSTGVPPAALEGFGSICLFRNILGIPCPGCGMTHAFLSIGHGDIPGAFSMNPLGVVVYGICVLMWLQLLVRLAGRRVVKISLGRVERTLLLAVCATAAAGVWYLKIVV